MRRWTSEGGTPGRTPLYPSREGSIPTASREVRCACQYFQSDSLLPDRYNPVGSRPISPVQSTDSKSYLSDYSQQPADLVVNTAPRDIVRKLSENIDFTKSSSNAQYYPSTKIRYSDSNTGLRSTLSASRRPASAYAHLQSDHEYEPVGKLPVESCEATNSGTMSVSMVEDAGETHQRAKSEEDPEWLGDDASSTTSRDRQFLHPANEEDNEAFSGAENDMEAHNAALELQKEIEDKYFVNTPTTTESRTDCEISTSQVDSSAIENLPLKRDSRKKNTVAQETAKLRQKISTQTGKIKSHAGKIKTKLKTIKKPQFTMPERPKFNMPERPKFSFPERPKINFPDRSKFKMPERPKINLPERPKLRFPERPKFNLPERPKFNFPDRPKLHFPDRPKFSLPDRSKFKLPERPKINFSTFTRNKENRPSVDETTTTEPSVSSKKNFLDFDFRTYPRIFNKKKKDVSGERPGTPPPGFATVPRGTKDRKQVVASQWEHASSRTTDDEPRHYGVDYSYDKEPDFQTKLAQVERDYREMQQEGENDSENQETPVRATLENKELWNAIERNTIQQLEHRSSLPHLSSNINSDKYDDATMPDDDESSAASAGQHRRGVLEEINNDEFFLRQKGISQDNIEVGKYLSNEIRDAFRSPINALDQIDKDSRSLGSNNMHMGENDIEHFNSRYKEDSEEQICKEDDEINQNNLMSENDDGYYTFPPVRPSRAKKLKTLVQELPKEIITVAHDEDDEFSHVHLETIPTPNNFSDAKKNIESESNLENFQKRVFGSSFKEPEILENLNEYENEIEQTKDMPTIPKRRRKNPSERKYSESESLLNENIDTQEWIDPEFSDMKNETEEQVIVHHIERVPTSSNVGGTPVAPRRSRSRGSRTTSVGDDDRTSRGAESLTLDSHVQTNNGELDYMDDLDDAPGYAIVDKTLQIKNEEMAPPRPPPPIRKHRSAKSLSGDRQFFTVPRSLKDSSPPRRPSRNYSTLGPSRPPRKKSTTSLSGLESIQKTSSSGDVTQYVEIEDDDELHKNLKSGDVVSKMKDRPLPPPPRPPRGPKKKKDSNDVDNIDDDVFEITRNCNEIDLSCEPTLTAELRQNNLFAPDDNNNDVAHSYNKNMQNASLLTEVSTEEDDKPYEIPDQEQVIEIEVSTQTDPLPDDFDYDLGLDEPLSETFDIKSSSNDLTKEEAEESSIDVELMSKGLQKFRESSRPSSRSSKMKSPVDRPKTPLGRMSPTAILVERRVSSPTRINEREEVVTEASLTVQPIDEPEIIESQKFSLEHRFYPTASDVMHSTNVPQSTKDHSIQQNEILKSSNDIIKEDAPPLQEAKSVSQEIKSIPLPETPSTSAQITQSNVPEVEVFKTQKLQISDLDVERLNVSELQASKILVSEIEGLSLQVNDVNSKSGHIYVRGIELAPGVIEELLEKFAQMVPPSATNAQGTSTKESTVSSQVKPDVSRETQTEEATMPVANNEVQEQPSNSYNVFETPLQNETIEPPPRRPPPPTIHPAMFQPIPCYPEYALPSPSYYRYRRPLDRRHDGLSDDEHPPQARSRKHRREQPISSSEDEDYKPISRRIPANQLPPEASEPSEASVSELSMQLLRACQNSVSRTIQHIVAYIKKHFGEVQSKKEVEMAVVIFLVMAAGLIMLSLGDGRTVHHHHWDFINPPDSGKH